MAKKKNFFENVRVIAGLISGTAFVITGMMGLFWFPSINNFVTLISGVVIVTGFMVIGSWVANFLPKTNIFIESIFAAVLYVSYLSLVTLQGGNTIVSYVPLLLTYAYASAVFLMSLWASEKFKGR